MTTNLSKRNEQLMLNFIDQELEKTRLQQRYRSLRAVAGEQGPVISLNEREVVNLSSNNYLGLANHPLLKRAGKDAIDRYGCGAGASRLISGNMVLHEELEGRLARFKGTEAALVFNSGFQANVGLLSTLVGKDDLIFSDALNHASIIDGCRLARADVVIYEHCDMNALEDRLKRAPQKTRRKLVVTETIFSMDGDVAPLPELVGLAERYGAMVMVDEAHATGVLGAQGAGAVQEFSLANRIPIQMGTLGKALGVFGAYVACPHKVRDFLINRCRSFIFTTALPPMVPAMVLAALDVLEREPERREVLRRNGVELKEALERLGYELAPRPSHIIPVMIKDDGDCMKLASRLLELGVLAQGIRPPTVPPGTARLRVTAMATHTPQHLAHASKAFAEARERV